MKNLNSEVKFIGSSKISEYLYCPICLVVYHKPFRLFCGHVLCCECFHQYVSESKVKLCPLDRSNVDFSLVHRDYIAERFVGELEVYCEYRHLGCKWKGKRKCLDAHKRSCPGKKLTEQSPEQAKQSQLEFNQCFQDESQNEEKLDNIINDSPCRLGIRSAMSSAIRFSMESPQASNIHQSIRGDLEMTTRVKSLLILLGIDPQTILEVDDVGGLLFN